MLKYRASSSFGTEHNFLSFGMESNFSFIREKNIFLGCFYHEIKFFILRYLSLGTQHIPLLSGMGPNRFSRKKPFSIGYAAIGMAPVVSLHSVSFLYET